MVIEIGKQYLTLCKLTVSITGREEDERDHFPMVGKFENGSEMGKTDFWMEDGSYYGPMDIHDMDLVSEV